VRLLLERADHIQHCAMLPPTNNSLVSVLARAFLSSTLSAASSVPRSAASSLTSDSCCSAAWRAATARAGKSLLAPQGVKHTA
jgi:hypothetical protein